MKVSGLKGVQIEEEVSLKEKLTHERRELNEKIERLKLFVTMDSRFTALDWKHRNLLEDQLRAMTRYEETLVERLVLLNTPNKD